ncbi:MAG: hypothetical protein A2Y38_02825 [Spirochaetes bacterium GWB1_59_5]|nr:MAG: hypothetical protein A2Y38_02825 [Spirochaetes bacterium GWB1_59_5]
MNLNHYFTQHPGNRSHLFSVTDPERPEFLRAGVLQFTPETAASWAGPLEGDVACYVLKNCRLGRRPYVGLPFPVAQRKAAERVQGWLALKPKGPAKLREALTRIEAGDPATVHQVNEAGTEDHPFRLWVYGNDDTSYSKWFRTREEAEAFIDLLETAEPLDMQRDFLDFGFTFTN